MNRSHVVSVALPLPIRRDFRYRVPERIPAPEAGTRVRVPFGERVLTGIVVGRDEAKEEAPPGLREILEVLDEEAVCPRDLLAAAGAARRSSLTSSLWAGRPPPRRFAPRRVRARRSFAGSSSAAFSTALSRAGARSLPSCLPAGPSWSLRRGRMLLSAKCLRRFA